MAFRVHFFSTSSIFYSRGFLFTLKSKYQIGRNYVDYRKDSSLKKNDFLFEQGLVYTITDVEDLHQWMVTHLQGHRLFERLTAEELAADPVVPKLYESTEEGQKVTRNKGDKFLAVFRRTADPHNAAV